MDYLGFFSIADEDSDGSQDNHIDEAHLIENSTMAERVMSPQGITEAPAERRDSGNIQVKCNKCSCF